MEASTARYLNGSPALKSDGVRCWNCNRLHAELVTAPYRWRCPKCGAIVAEGLDTVAVPLQDTR